MESETRGHGMSRTPGLFIYPDIPRNFYGTVIFPFLPRLPIRGEREQI